MNNNTGSVNKLDLFISNQLANTYITTARSLNLHNIFLCFEKIRSVMSKWVEIDQAENKAIIKELQLSHLASR